MRFFVSGASIRTVLCLASLGAAAFGASRDGDAIPNLKLLPDLQVHLDRAAESLRVGDYRGAQAQSEAILLPQDLKVFFDLYGVPSDKQDGLRRLFYDAAGMWQPAVGSDVRFVETARRSDANVVVTFREEVRGYAPQVGGHATWRRSVRRLNDENYDVSVKANIAIRTVAPNGQAMSYTQMRHACAHEIGHVLGLADSERIGDVMGPLDLSRPVTTVSDKELDSLRKLRSAAIEIRRQSVVGWLSGL